MLGMNSMESKTYGVKFQARCIAALTAEKHVTRFLIGTLSLRDENEVHLVQLSEDGSSIVCEGLFGHQHEIWDLAGCPFDPLLFSTVYASAGEYSAALWRMPHDKYSSNHLEHTAQFTGISAPIKRVLWHPDLQIRDVVSLDEESLRVWDFSSGTTLTQKASVSAGSLQQINTGAWAPLDPNMVATSSDSSISIWDLRSMTKTGSIDGAHNMQIRDLDFNPLRQNLLMSSGDDSRIKVWDLRALPYTRATELHGHNHWIWRARYNPFHDDLVLSSGTDSAVNLWRLSAAASGQQSSEGFRAGAGAAALGHKRVEAPGAGTPPAASYTDFEDSVYGIAWSAADPWIFASLSYDGRVVVDVVPPTIRSQLKR